MRTGAAWLAALLALMPAGSLMAHHSLAGHDKTPVRVKGTIVRFHAINPHSIIFVDEETEDGRRRWAVEGPSGFQLRRQNSDVTLKPGDAIEFCGYMPGEARTWQIASEDPNAVSLSGRLITAEMIVLDGQVQSWSDYGFHHCFPPDYRDQHSQ